jgi:trehalose 6-phosphate phosphatase
MTAPYPMRLGLDHVSLFLDLDGTLFPFALNPDDPQPNPALSALLRDLTVRLSGRVAVVSGRALSDIDRILEGRVSSVAGTYGLQRRDARLDMITADTHPNLDAIEQQVRDFAYGFEGVSVERKPLSVAIHYRGNPSAESLAQAFAETLSKQTGVGLQQGTMALEFTSREAGVGRAIRAFMIEPPFIGSVPVFVGGGFIDEDGFRVVRTLGGFGVCVGDNEVTQARYRLKDPVDVLTWLGTTLDEDILKLETCVVPAAFMH